MATSDADAAPKSRRSRRRALAFVAVAFVALASVSLGPREDPWDFEITLPYTDAEDPFTAERLAARARRIAPLVEEIVGTAIDLDGVGWGTMDAATIAQEAVEAEWGDRLSATHPQFHAALGAATRAQFTIAALSTTARYLPTNRTIQFSPIVCVASSRRLGIDLDRILDVVMAHELVHVWQHQAFGRSQFDVDANDLQGALAKRAAIEGCAEYISRRVAARLGFASVFDAMSIRPEEHVQEIAPGSIDQHQHFLYEQGRSYVLARLGPDASPEELRAFHDDPPHTIYEIQHGSHEPSGARVLANQVQVCLQLLLDRLELEWRQSFPFKGWDGRPCYSQDLKRRAELVSSETATWFEKHARGGCLLASKEPFGFDAGVGVMLRIYRFQTPRHASEAERRLAEAFRTRGLGTILDPQPESELDTSTWTSEVRDGWTEHRAVAVKASRPYVEHVCVSYMQSDSLLFELVGGGDEASFALRGLMDLVAETWRDSSRGAAPAPPHKDWVSLDRMRDEALGEETLVAMDAPKSAWVRGGWTRRLKRSGSGRSRLEKHLRQGETSAWVWLAALAPEQSWSASAPRRMRFVQLALDSDVLDVRMQALAAIAEGWGALGPRDQRLVEALLERLASERAVERVAAVHALARVAEDLGNGGGVLAKIVTDTSLAVRIALVSSKPLRELLTEAESASLVGDVDPRVRRLAEEGPAPEPGPHAFLMRYLGLDRLLPPEAGGSGDEADREDADPEAPVAEQDPLTVVIGLALDADSNTEAEWREIVGRIWAGIAQQERPYRRIAWYLAASFLPPERRTGFLRGIIREYGDPLWASGVEAVLSQSGWRRSPARPHLMKALGCSALRRSALVALAHDQDLVVDSMRSELQAWAKSDDSRLAITAALLLRRIPTQTVAADDVLGRHFARVPAKDRAMVLELLAASPTGGSLFWDLAYRCIREPMLGEGSQVMLVASKHKNLSERLRFMGLVLEIASSTLSMDARKELLDAMNDDDEGESAREYVRGKLEQWAREKRSLDPELDFFHHLELDFTPSVGLLQAIRGYLAACPDSELALALALLKPSYGQGRWGEFQSLARLREQVLLAWMPRKPAMAAAMVKRVLMSNTTPPDVSVAVLRTWARVCQEWDGIYFFKEIYQDEWEEPGPLPNDLVDLIVPFLREPMRGSFEIGLALVRRAHAQAVPLLPDLRKLLPELRPGYQERLKEVLESIAMGN